MSESTRLEIVVPAGTQREVARKLGAIAHARIVSDPSRDRSTRHICFTLARSIEQPDGEFLKWTDSMRARLGDAPLVVLWHEGEAHAGDWKIAQRVAYLGYEARRSTYVAPDVAAARRLFIAQTRGAESMLIASAELAGDSLEVWSCEPKLYRIPLANLPVLADLERESLGRFEISASGSRIRWPDADIDLNLEVMRAATDPILLQEHRSSYGAEVKDYGQAIRRLRELHGLRQTDIAGLTDRTVRRVEQGLVLPHGETLKKLALAHRLSVTDYMQELTSYLEPRPGSGRAPR